MRIHMHRHMRMRMHMNIQGRELGIEWTYEAWRGGSRNAGLRGWHMYAHSFALAHPPPPTLTHGRTGTRRGWSHKACIVCWRHLSMRSSKIHAQSPSCVPTQVT